MRPRDRVISAVDCLKEVGGNSGEVIADERQHAQQIVAHTLALDPLDSFHYLLVGNAQNQQITHRKIEGVVVEARWVENQSDKETSNSCGLVSPITGKMLNRRNAKLRHG